MLKSKNSIQKQQKSRLTSSNNRKRNGKQLKINITSQNIPGNSKEKGNIRKTSRNQSNSKTKKNNDQNNSSSRMEKIKSKTLKLESQVSELNSKISETANDTILLSDDYTNKLSNLDNDIKNCSKQYNLLYNKLTKYDTDFNEKIKSINIIRVVTNKKSKNNDITDINKEIQLKEEMIKNNNKIIQDLENNIKRFEKIIEKTPEDTMNTLNNELEEITNIEKDMSEEVNSLQKMKNAHFKNCTKQTSNLLNEFDKLQIEYNYEIKKNNANDDNNISKETPSNTENTQKTSTNDLKNSSPYYFRINKNESLNKKRKLKLLSIKNKNNNPNNNANINNSYDNNNLTIVRNRINKEGESIILKKLKGMDNNFEDKNLFSTEEKQNLEKYIPEEYLRTYEGIYNEQKNQTEILLSENLKKNLDKKKLIQKNTNKIDEIEQKYQKLIENRVSLNSKISSIRKIKMEMNLKYKKYEIESKKILKKYNDIMETNQNLKKEFFELYNKIKNGDLIIKKGMKLNEENLEAIKKWGDKSEDVGDKNRINNNK